jgi:hypothetical protein
MPALAVKFAVLLNARVRMCQRFRRSCVLTAYSRPVAQNATRTGHPKVTLRKGWASPRQQIDQAINPFAAALQEVAHPAAG